MSMYLGADKLSNCPGNGVLGLECTDHILSALNAGYRLIDTAPDHQNAKSVGAALQRWGGDRAHVYIVSQCESWSVRDRCGGAD
jgi:diketogulonate reductase-like aldo/keto reductase